jgi:hypothetical protein
MFYLSNKNTGVSMFSHMAQKGARHVPEDVGHSCLRLFYPVSQEVNPFLSHMNVNNHKINLTLSLVKRCNFVQVKNKPHADANVLYLFLNSTQMRTLI